jgi:hypothetical protein
VSYAFRPSGPEGDDLIAALRTRGGRPGPAGSIVLNDRGEGDARVIVFPGVVAVEGRLQALLTGDEDDHGLAHPAGLPDGAERARAAIAGLLGADLGLGPSELRRLDLAGELQFDDGRDGLALLDAMAGLYAPRRKTVVWRKGAEPQTVYWVTEKTGQVRQRAYDKGVESGTHAPGERIRLELQHRPPKSRRRTPVNVANGDLSALYVDGLKGWTNERPTLRGEPEHVMAVLLDRVARGDMSQRKAESLVGQMVALRVAGQGELSDQSYRYRLRELQAAGIVLDAPKVEREVPVARHLSELRNRFAA